MTPRQKAIEAAARALALRRCHPSKLTDKAVAAHVPTAEAAVAAYLSAMREAGWKMTPEEPTEEMKKASSRGDGNRAAFYWRAMHKAAPEPE